MYHERQLYIEWRIDSVMTSSPPGPMSAYVFLDKPETVLWHKLLISFDFTTDISTMRSSFVITLLNG